MNMNKSLCINAIQWYYGCTKKQAANILKNNSIDIIENIVKVFQDNARKSFYTD